MLDLFKQTLNVELSNDFPRMTYQEAMQRFGTDRPDLRIPLELIDVADVVKDAEFKVFSGPANDPAGRVAVLRLPKGGELTRKQIDDYTKFVSIYGAKGLAYIKVNDTTQGRDGLQSPILKFLSDEAINTILRRSQASNGDLLFFGADKAHVVNEALGALRVKLGQDCGLVESGWRFVWIVDFPMFTWDAATKRWDPLHHPFTAPQTENPQDVIADPGNCLSRAYDLVLNGIELGGGSIRIHSVEMQLAVLKLLNIDKTQAEQRFGFLLEALKYGCPPHGGVAFGLDRIIMLLAGAQSLREVIAFPKTQTASCLLTNAPAEVDEAQLKELGIRRVQ